MEWHRNHWLDLGKINLNHAIVICDCTRCELLISFFSTVNLIKFFGLLIGFPDGRKTCRLCCHNIHADSIINTHVMNTRSNEFHHFILNISSVKHFANNRKCNILRTNTLSRCSCHIYTDSLSEKLLNKLRAALSNSHCSKSAISCMRVRTKNHLAAFR